MGKKVAKKAAAGDAGRGPPTKKGALKSKRGKGSGRGKKPGKKAGAKGLRKGAGKGAGKAQQKQAAAGGETGSKRGQKRSAIEASKEAGAEEQGGKKGKKPLSAKKQRRKEVTKLYSELINNSRDRKSSTVVGEILELLKKRSDTLAEYCSKDIGSRVVQACLKWGSREQRRHLLSVLKEHIHKMAVDRYGHMVVLKLLRYVSLTSKERKPTDEESKARAQNVKDLLESFRGKNLHAIFYHRHGCRVINSIYYSEAVKKTERRRMLQEVAVPQSVAMRRAELPGTKELRQLLHAEDMSAEQRSAMMEHLREVAEKAVDKELLGFDVVHLVFQAFCEDASEAQLKDLADKCMAGAPYLLSSKPGAEALLRLLGVATAKQRKSLCRDLKGKFAALAMNSVDYTVMMRLACTVDDTVLLGKTVFAEWTPELEAICFDQYGHRVLAWLLAPGDARLFSPYEISCLALPAPGSVKAPATRRQEVLRILKPPVRSVLLGAPLKTLVDLHAKNVLAAYLSADWDAELAEAILKACEEAAAEKDFGALNDGTATTSLIVLLKIEPDESKSSFALALWRRCFQPRLVAAATSRCVFLLLAMLKKGGKLREAVLGALRSGRKEIEVATKTAEANGATVSGAQQLLKALKEA